MSQLYLFHSQMKISVVQCYFEVLQANVIFLNSKTTRDAKGNFVMIITIAFLLDMNTILIPRFRAPGV